MLHRYGAFVARRAKLLLALSFLVMVAAGVLGAGAFGKLKNGGFADPAAESTQAQQLIDAHFGGQTNLVLLVRAKTGDVDETATATAGAAVARALSAEPEVTDVVSYFGTRAPALRSADGTSALVLGHINGDEAQVAARSEAVVAQLAGDRGPVTVLAGGLAGINHDVTSQVTRSLAIAEAIAVPLTLVLLVFAFGSVVSAALPLAIGGVAILGTFAELFVLGSVTDVSIFAINLTTALGLGLGIDYALFMVSRFREQLAKGDTVPEAVAATVANAGRTVIFTAVAVMAALSALLVFPLYFLRSFGYAGIGVVAIAALGALVLLPALLSVLGHRVNAGRVRWTRAADAAASPWWGRLAGRVMRRPALAALPVVAVLLFVASPLLGIGFGTPDEGVLRSTVDSRQVSAALLSQFPGNAAAPIDVVTTGPADQPAVAAYARQISLLPDIARVVTSAGAFSHGSSDPTGANPAFGRPDGQRITIVTTLPAKSDRSQDRARDIRALPGPGGVPVLVGGADAQLIDTRDVIAQRLPIALGLVVLTTLIVLFLFTGSVIQPIRAVLLNALSLSATLGALTWIFQNGHLAGLLHVTPRPMDMSMTVLLFCIAFGLSMDYEVFVLSRIKEMHDRGVAPAEAVSTGLARSGRIVSTAAVLLAVSFFAFGTSTVSFLQMFGIGAGLAILIDATLIRGVLVPASMRVLGPLAWYSPAPLRRVYHRVALSET
jgi:RND superfamily putative drug exporter